ncbi:hypothetical protein BJ508DRAFT_52778 [Ascobolus immersus RN42]|uniref:Uncharacterized protein n=1 Tax=Ascobolus immersus RN42 TaxID=1160509 RepID=A0A3N4HML8_ASCIM|nr:hypothetical protein BJ508DRAFT_52778 [Ascobolus immersus RN42]
MESYPMESYPMESYPMESYIMPPMPPPESPTQIADSKVVVAETPQAASVTVDVINHDEGVPIGFPVTQLQASPIANRDGLANKSDGPSDTEAEPERPQSEYFRRYKATLQDLESESCNPFGFSGPLYQEFKHSVAHTAAGGRTLATGIRVFNRQNVIRATYSRDDCRGCRTPLPLAELVEHCMQFYDADYFPFSKEFSESRFCAARSAGVFRDVPINIHETIRAGFITDIVNLMQREELEPRFRYLRWQRRIAQMMGDRKLPHVQDKSGLVRRYDAGLLRQEQIDVIRLALDGVMAEQKRFIRNQNSDWEQWKWTEPDILRVILQLPKASGPETMEWIGTYVNLLLLLDRATVLLEFLAGLQSVRLERLLLKYLREEETDVELGHRVDRLSYGRMREDLLGCADAEEERDLERREGRPVPKFRD